METSDKKNPTQAAAEALLEELGGGDILKHAKAVSINIIFDEEMMKKLEGKQEPKPEEKKKEEEKPADKEQGPEPPKDGDKPEEEDEKKYPFQK